MGVLSDYYGETEYSFIKYKLKQAVLNIDRMNGYFFSDKLYDDKSGPFSAVSFVIGWGIRRESLREMLY